MTNKSAETKRLEQAVIAILNLHPTRIVPGKSILDAGVEIIRVATKKEAENEKS